MKRRTILFFGIFLILLFGLFVNAEERTIIEVAGVEEVECYFSISGYKDSYNVDVVDIANDLGISYTITYHNNYGNCVTINNSYDCQRMRDEISRRSTSNNSNQTEYYPDYENREQPRPTILGYILLLVVLWWLADALKSGE